MFRIMQRWLRRAKPQAASRPAVTCKPAADTAVLLVRVPAQPESTRSAAGQPTAFRPAASASRTAPQHQVKLPDAGIPPAAASLASHSIAAGEQTAEVPARTSRKKREAQPLTALGVFPARLLRKLRRVGLRHCDDLLAADPAALVQQIGAPQHGTATIRRYQRAIRFSRRFSAMTPHEALLLFAAHRRSFAGLASENAGILRRDLERLLLSSRGQKLAAGRPVPEIPRVRQWVAEAKSIQERKNRALRAAEGHSELLRLAPARNSAG